MRRRSGKRTVPQWKVNKEERPSGGRVNSNLRWDLMPSHEGVFIGLPIARNICWVQCVSMLWVLREGSASLKSVIQRHWDVKPFVGQVHNPSGLVSIECNHAPVILGIGRYLDGVHVSNMLYHVASKHATKNSGFRKSCEMQCKNSVAYVQLTLKKIYILQYFCQPETIICIQPLSNSQFCIFFSEEECSG